MTTRQRNVPTWAGVLRAWSRDPGGLITLSLGGYTLLYLLWLIFKWGNAESQALITAFAYLPIDLAAVGLAWRAATQRRLPTPIRRAWRWLALAYLLLGIGDLLWYDYYGLLLGHQPFPSWADAVYLSFYPVLLVGLLSFHQSPLSRSELRTFWLDAGMVLLGSGMGVYYFILYPTLLAAHSGPLATATALAYPMGDLVVLFGVVATLFGRRAGSCRQALSMLVTGLFFLFIADFAFVYLTLHNQYESAGWPHAFCMLTRLFIVLSAQYQHWHASHSGETVAREAPVRERVSALPYIAIVSSYCLLLAAASEQWAMPLGGLIVGSVVLTGLVVVRQITAVRDNVRLVAEHAARQSEMRFRSLVQNASDMIAVIDADGIIRYQSPSIKPIMGYCPEDVVGVDSITFVHPDDRASVKLVFREALGTPGITPMVEVRIHHHDGSWRYMKAVFTNLLNDPGVRGVVLNCRDITERKAFEQQLTHQAFHDSLTGLPNRALLMTRLDHALARAARHSSTVAVLFFDLDRFKVINDSLGHEAGDHLLIGVARRFQECLRSEDTPARLGGDEFTILLEDVPNQDEAVQIAERIIAALRAPFLIGGHEIFITTSIGIVLSTGGRDSPADLMRNADIAMYRAKSRGRARYEVFDKSMNERALERLDLEAAMRRAYERSEFVLHYQPKVDLATGRIAAMEALIRWQHPERGLVPPAEFIPVAEETGLIRLLGQWGLEEACRQAHEWHIRYPADPPLIMSVNLSAQQVQQPSLVQDITRALQQTQLDPRQLQIEIIESVIMEDAPSTIVTLYALKELGVQLAIDDFGTGYSSLSYLKRFPVDVLKVDKVFVAGLGRDPEDTAIVRAVITLSHTLGMKVTAEGVETAEQMAYLQSLGCELGQGYYFAKPLTPEAVARLLEECWSYPVTPATPSSVLY
jgi:diguanylate cyclase (GGDEF)-like protein/PAS domain S-box-containing protein